MALLLLTPGEGACLVCGGEWLGCIRISFLATASAATNVDDLRSVHIESRARVERLSEPAPIDNVLRRPTKTLWQWIMNRSVILLR